MEVGRVVELYHSRFMTPPSFYRTYPSISTLPHSKIQFTSQKVGSKLKATHIQHNQKMKSIVTSKGTAALPKKNKLTTSPPETKNKQVHRSYIYRERERERERERGRYISQPYISFFHLGRCQCFRNTLYFCNNWRTKISLNQPPPKKKQDLSLPFN